MASFFNKQTASRHILTQQLGAVGSAAVVSTGVFGVETFQIRIATLADLRFLVLDPGQTAVTSTTGALLPATTGLDFLTVTPGQRLSTIANSATATVTVTELG